MGISGLSLTPQSRLEAEDNCDVPQLAEARFPPRIPRLAFSIKETAKVLGVSEKTVRRLVYRRLLHPSRALRHLLISQKEVERFLADTAK